LRIKPTVFSQPKTFSNFSAPTDCSHYQGAGSSARRWRSATHALDEVRDNIQIAHGGDKVWGVEPF
jgi:hypothetical protein